MKISNEVMVILSNIECDGENARITQELTRNEYVAVNKVLVAAGGKWNRKAGAHVFGSGNAAEAIDMILLTGAVETARDVGWFPTPADIASMLVDDHVREGDLVLEPSAGEGALVIPILTKGARVIAIERDSNRRKKLCDAVQQLFGPEYAAHERFLCEDMQDFMEYQNTDEFHTVIMNPPFTKVGIGDQLDHVRHAFSMLRRGGVLKSIMSSGVQWREDNRYKEFRNWAKSNNGHFETLPPKSFNVSGTNVNTVILTLYKDA